MFHKEGYQTIILSIVLSAGLLLLVDKATDNRIVVYTLGILTLLLVFLVLWFFRNPKREARINHHQVLAPVDGKVVVIEEVEEHEYFNDKRLQISIFMSPLNVHVTRYPVGGEVVYSKYHPGKFLVAWHPKSSTDNERTTVVVRTKEFGDVLFRQVAGAVARRIVNYAEEGDEAVQGDDSGFIKFGSRLDVFLPLDAKIDVQLKDKVKGALTTIAHK
ncbi:phosphatidylserine decarboxylase family protein [Croceiramulus getboli]|nr:phosphatidylserine decarboxylase family protein [Flavobacteriaceae bacterium YJPT1-3]